MRLRTQAQLRSVASSKSGSRRFASSVLPGLTLASSLLLLAGTAHADMILVQWDAVKDPDAAGRMAPKGAGPYKDMIDALPNGDARKDGVKRTEVTGVDLKGNAIFDDTKPYGFTSVGFKSGDGKIKGGIFQNKTGKTIGDIHIELLRKNPNGTPKDMIDPASKPAVAGDAFPNVTISPDGQKITFATDPGKEIAKDAFLWNFMTKMQKADNGGMNPYQGYLTATAPPKAPEKKQEGGTKSGNTGSGGGPSPKMNYDGTNMNFDPVIINATTYADGSHGDSSDAMAGATMMISPMEFQGTLPSLGGFSLGESSVLITDSLNDIFLSATLVDCALLPDSSVSGFNAVIQGTLTWSMGDLTLGSRAMGEFFPVTDQAEMNFFFRTNMLFDGNGNPLSGDYFGSSEIALPAPGAVGVLGLLAGAAARRRRR